jgi:hypothetical protein
VTFAAILGKSCELHDEADRASSRLKAPAFQAAQKATYAAWSSNLYDLLDVLPNDGALDALILAGHASMIADQLKDIISDDDKHGQRVARGIENALCSLVASIARSEPSGIAQVSAVYPELAASIRRDLMVNDARRADAEGC